MSEVADAAKNCKEVIDFSRVTIRSAIEKHIPIIISWRRKLQ